MIEDKVGLGEQRPREVCEDGGRDQTDTTTNHKEFPWSWRTRTALLVPVDLPWLPTSGPQTGIQSVSCFKQTAYSLSSSSTGGNRQGGPALRAEARVLNAHLL